MINMGWNDYIEPDNSEEVEGEKCTECGGTRIMRSPRQSSPDDYVWQYDCKDCGATWED